MEDIELEIGLEVIKSYKRLSYTPWYAFAEFVDNSTQAYFNNQIILDSHFNQNGERLTVEIDYDPKSDLIKISDNSIGMSHAELSKAIKIGIPPDNDTQRSKYGLGLKTAASWFGNVWSVETKKLGEEYSYKITVDVETVATNKQNVLKPTIEKKDRNEHYTIIEISSLNRKYRGNTIKKIKEYLSSMYRFDFRNIGLVLRWQGGDLNWEGFEKRFYITQDNKPYKINFEFSIGEGLFKKNIKGWVGVLAKGSRKDAGFSIIQNNRVIKSSYKPESVFGEQEFGTNDLINQRVVGELFMDGFAVSHTKDNILWEDDEEEEVNNMLGEKCADAKVLASTLRVKDIVNDKTEAYKNQALDTLESELKSSEIKDTLFNEQIPEDRALQVLYSNLIKYAKKSDEPSIEVQIGDKESLNVKIFFRNASEFEPYVLFEASVEEKTLNIIINALHPYWLELKNVDGFLDYVRHCVYDGLSEWRASKNSSTINYDTVKYIKDRLLRIPYTIVNNKFSNENDTD